MNVAPLFSARAAVAQLETDPDYGGWSDLVANTGLLSRECQGLGWRLRVTDESLQTGILLAEAERRKTRAVSPDTIRERFQRHGVVLSAYESGLIRLSAPRRPLLADEVELLRAALHRCG